MKKLYLACGSEQKYKKFLKHVLKGLTFHFCIMPNILFHCQDSYCYFSLYITVYYYLLFIPRTADDPESQLYGANNWISVFIKLLLGCLYLFCKAIQH